MSVIPRWVVGRIDRNLQSVWGDRLAPAVRRPMVTLWLCRLGLLSIAGLWGLPLSIATAMGKLDVGRFAGACLPVVLLGVLLVRTFARADRRLHIEVAAALGLPSELAPLLNLRDGVPALDASARRVRTMADDDIAEVMSRGWGAARERRIAMVWGHRLSAQGIRAARLRSQWGIAWVTGAVIVVVCALALPPHEAVAVVAVGASLLALVGWQVHRWGREAQRDAGMQMGISGPATRRLVMWRSLEAFDASAERSRRTNTASGDVGD